MGTNMLAGAIVAMLAVAGCSSAPSGSGIKTIGNAAPKRLFVCHGYGCTYRTRLDLGASDGAKFKAILAAGKASPNAERAAISRAVQYFENRTYQVIGIRDLPKGAIGASRIKGQMDCIDESTNTNALLLYLANRGLLKHHTVAKKQSRGFFFDGRYPHWTAAIRDSKGELWVVDSWYAPMGGAPDIMPLSAWKPRGVMGSNEPAA